MTLPGLGHPRAGYGTLGGPGGHGVAGQLLGVYLSGSHPVTKATARLGIDNTHTRCAPPPTPMYSQCIHSMNGQQSCQHS